MHKMSQDIKYLPLPLLLAAVARIEGWDAKHDSIRPTKSGCWAVDRHGNPQPSLRLIAEVRRLYLKQLPPAEMAAEEEHF
jgi:hypothetical protein